MRTTLTLDDDVAAAIERIRKTRGTPLKLLVNEAIREGLKQMQDRPKRRRTFRTGSADLGKLRIGSIDNVAEVLAVAEGDFFR
jgi:hypothetical protein